MIVLGLSTLTFPSSAKALFGRDAPMVVEIGVGSGRFMEYLARRRPDLNVLGIDRAPQSIARTFRRLQRREIRNARLLKGDADWFVRNVLPCEALHRVYVNFPDPWPRKKHLGRRLLQKSFLRSLSSRLTPEGDVLVTTDHDAYFDFVVRNAEAAGCFDVDLPRPPCEVLETKWARKAAVHRHAALRLKHPASPLKRDVELEEAMYHAVVTGNLPDLTAFEKRTFRHGRGVAVLMEVYRPLAGRGFIFLVHVEEDGLRQDVIVDVREGKQGFVVALRRFGEPLHTRGLSTAVRLITEWLADQGMTILHTKY